MVVAVVMRIDSQQRRSVTVSVIEENLLKLHQFALKSFVLENQIRYARCK